MSLQKYKKIEDKRGYFIDDIDSKVYETGVQPSLYGSGTSDVLRFSLYDVNDNLLPQKKYGNVRFITSNQLSDYFTKTRDEERGSNQSIKYELNVDKLIEEAGYNTGIFKIEVLLVNDRVGIDKQPMRVWIHEISPSRTELRVLPIKVNNKEGEAELTERYNTLLRNGMFFDDVKEMMPIYLDKIDERDIESILLSQIDNGTLNQIKQHYAASQELSNLFINILDTYKKTMMYIVEHRDSNIDNSTYGKRLSTKEPISLDIHNIALQKLVESINHHLPKISVRETEEIKYIEI